MIQETTALGAAYLAGLAEGVWASPAEITANWQPRRHLRAGVATRTSSPPQHAAWARAVERSRALGRRRADGLTGLGGASARTPPIGWRQAYIGIRPSFGAGLGVGARVPPIGVVYGSVIGSSSGHGRVVARCDE